MPRKKLILNKSFPYHVTARANNREWFHLPMDEIWEIFKRLSTEIIDEYGARLHALVVMSNHFHLLLTTPGGNLGELMNQFQREISRSINRSADRTNHNFGGPYKWSLIGNALHYRHALKYVYRNPVKAGLVQAVEEYAFSSLRFQLNPEESQFPTSPSIFDAFGPLSQSLNLQLDWFNGAHSKKENDCVKRALRHRVFEFTPDPSSRVLPKIFEGAF